MPLLTSNTNFMPICPQEAQSIGRDATPLLTLQRLSTLVSAIEADGVEIMPIRSPHYLELQIASQAKRAGDYVLSLHESPRGHGYEMPDYSLRDQLAGTKHPTSMMNRLGAAALLPKGERALHRLAGIAKNLGKETIMQCVVFPHARGSVGADRTTASLFPAGALVQPTPDIAAAWGIDPRSSSGAQAFANQLRKRNLRAVLPTFDLRRRGSVVPHRLPGRAYEQTLLEHDLVDEVHIELNRVDFRATDPASAQTSRDEAIALITGNPLDKLPLGQTLQVLKEACWKGNMVVKMGLRSTCATLAAINRKPTKYNILGAHRTVVERLRSELPYA